MPAFAPPPRLALHHIALLVEDLHGVETFYRDCLGLEVEKRWSEPDNSDRSVWLCLDNDSRLMLEKCNPGSPRRGPKGAGWHLLALTISPRDRTHWKEHLTRKRVPIIEESEFSLYINDPEGNRIALSHWPESSRK